MNIGLKCLFAAMLCMTANLSIADCTTGSAMVGAARDAAQNDATVADESARRQKEVSDSMSQCMDRVRNARVGSSISWGSLLNLFRQFADCEMSGPSSSNIDWGSMVPAGVGGKVDPAVFGTVSRGANKAVDAWNETPATPPVGTNAGGGVNVYD